MDKNIHLYVAISGAIPALFAMWLFDRLDAKRPEPLSLRLLVSLCGALSCIPALAIELALGAAANRAAMPQVTYPGAAIQAFVVAAMVEEACKISVVYWVVWKRPAFDERMDGIVYAARAGLGFALVENIGYLIMQPTTAGQLQLWIVRAVLAIPGHAMWTATMGYFAARRRFDRWGPGILGGYLLAVAGHGLYDYAVFVGTPLTIEGRDQYVDLLKAVPPVIIVLFWLMVRRWARTALRLDDADAARNAGVAPAAG